MRVTVGQRLACRSVVSTGEDQLSTTRLPLRSAAKSLTCVGRRSEGGCGAPGAAQPAASNRAVQQAAKITRGFVKIPANIPIIIYKT